MLDFGNITLESKTIVDFLKREMRLKEICHEILTQQIIERAAREKHIAVTPEEIQAEADRIRYQMRLEKVADTLTWLKEQMTSLDEWEEQIRIHLLAKKLAKHLFDREAERFFAQNRVDFDRLIVYQIVVSCEKLAREIIYQLEDREINFYQAAHLYDIDEQRRYRCGYEGKLERWNLKPDIGAVLLNARLGEIVGPVKTEQGYHLLMLEDFIKAELTPSRHQEIVDRLFNEWLARELNYLLYDRAKHLCTVAA